MSNLPHRVLVVDDDPLIRRLVTLCLEGPGIELVTCESVESALAAVRAKPPRVLITDLMMPRASGWDLLRALKADATLAPGARLAVFSAGLQQADHQALTDLGVSRLLVKPVATQELSRFVQEALGTALPPARVQAGPPSPVDPFDGDEALRAEFLADCRAQFPHDLLVGEAALQEGDMRTLRRIAHDLKSVLRLIGETRGSDAAAVVEQAAARSDRVAAETAWGELRPVVEAVTAPPARG